jgi:hypothetical protein
LENHQTDHAAHQTGKTAFGRDNHRLQNVLCSVSPYRPPDDGIGKARATAQTMLKTPLKSSGQMTR